MSDQLEQQNNQSIPRLQAWLYWIDTDGMKIGIAMSTTSWLRLLVLIWLVPVSLALLLLGHVSLSIILALAEIALLNAFYAKEVPSRSSVFFLTSLLSIGLPLVGIGFIVWEHLSVGGIALLLSMLFRIVSQIRDRKVRRWTWHSMLIESISTLLAFGALFQITLPLLGNCLQTITVLLSIFFLPLTPRPGDWPEKQEGFYEVDLQGRPVRLLTNKLNLQHLTLPMLRPRFLRRVQQL
jgi:hypothetical protein